MKVMGVIAALIYWSAARAMPPGPMQERHLIHQLDFISSPPQAVQCARNGPSPVSAATSFRRKNLGMEKQEFDSVKFDKDGAIARLGDDGLPAASTMIE